MNEIKLIQKLILTTFLLYSSIVLSCEPQLAKPDNDQDRQERSEGHTSTRTMPLEYQLQFDVLKPLPQLDLDKINPHQGVPEERLNSWQPQKLKAKGFMVVMGVQFLNFKTEGFEGQFPSYLKLLDSHKSEAKQFYFSGFWDCIWLSASLVNPQKFPCVGDYGYILEIPPQLILKTYQLDTTTPTHSDLMERVKQGEDLNQFASDYLKFFGCYNSSMSVDSLGNVICTRIFAPGETEDSPHFMTPEEMIGRGRPKEHNEIKFLPKGNYNGVEYKVKLSGLWYNDVQTGTGMMTKQPTSEEIVKALHSVANDLKIDLIPLSQRK